MIDTNLDIRVKVIISGKDNDAHASAFGAGIVRLCELVDESGSLNKAAKEMGMAYSKAWRIIHETEEALNCQLLERRGPKGSVLTADGKRLVKIYNRANQKIKQASKEILAECLNEL